MREPSFFQAREQKIFNRQVLTATAKNFVTEMVPYFKIMYLVRRNSYSLASASERCHRERRRAIRGADGDVRPLPLGRGSTWRPADRCGQADQCAYVRPSEGRGVGRGGRRVRERAWVVTQLGGRWGGLGRCAPPRRGDARCVQFGIYTRSLARARLICSRRLIRSRSVTPQPFDSVHC